MKPADPKAIRLAMANCSKGEAQRINLPAGLATMDFPALEYLGWRDPKAPQRGYLVLWRGEKLVGLALRAPEGSSTRSIMCTLCRTTHTGGNVALFVARRGGDAGRNGNTVGTYICADLACSHYARLPKATAAVTPDPGLEVPQRLSALHRRTSAFVDRVLGTSGGSEADAADGDRSHHTAGRDAPVYDDDRVLD